MAKIKWYGRSTSGNWKRKVEADSMRDLYYACVDNGTISLEDYDPIEKYWIERAGLDYRKTSRDISDVAFENDTDYSLEFDKYCRENGIDTSLSDRDYYSIIKGEDGNAFYQTFEHEDGVQIQFDQEGNLL